MKTEKGSHLARFVLFTLLQSLVGWYLAVINGFLLLVGFLFLVGKKHLHRDFFLKCLAGGLVFSLVMLPFVHTYAKNNGSSRVFELRTSENMVSGEQLLFRDYFHPPNSTVPGQVFQNRRYSIWGEQTLYIGFVPVTLAFIGIWNLFGLFGHRREWAGISSRRLALLSGGLIATGGIFALGHNSHTLGIPLPWHFVCEAVPYLGIIRATPRFSLLIYMGILLLSLGGICFILSKVAGGRKKILLTGLISLFFLLEVFPFRLPFEAGKSFQYDPVDLKISELKQEAGRDLIAVHLLPNISSEDRFLLRDRQANLLARETTPEMRSRRQKELPGYLLGSTAHWSRLLEGISFINLQTRHYKVIVNLFPDKRALSLLRLYEVDLVVLHDIPEFLNRSQFAEILDSSRRIGEVLKVGDGKYILRIDRASLDRMLADPEYTLPEQSSRE